MARTSDPLQLAITDKVAELREAGKIAQGLTCSKAKKYPRLAYRTPGNNPQTAQLPIDWDLMNFPAIMQIMEDCTRMIEQGFTLQQSVDSIKQNANSTGGFDWKRAYLSFSKEQDWAIETQKFYEKWFKEMLELLADKNNPVADGKTLLQQYKRVHLQDPKKYRIGRRAFSFFSNLIDYSIRQAALDPAWEVTDKFRKSLLPVSKSQKRDKSTQVKTPPIQSPDYLALLDELEHSDPDLYTMCVLLGHYGLMGAELAVIRWTEQGMSTHKVTKDHALPKHRNPRYIESIDCLEREGLGERVAREWIADRRQLPKAVRNAISRMYDLPYSYKNPNYKAVGDAVRQLLDRCPAWKKLAKEKNLIAYSFRHSYSWRCHTEYNMEASRVAPWMGHRVDTHNDHYSEWFSQADQIRYKERMVAEARHRAQLTSQSNGNDA